MTSPLDSVLTLAHTPGGVMLGVLLLATVIGFVAGLFFERASSRNKQDRES